MKEIHLMTEGLFPKDYKIIISSNIKKRVGYNIKYYHVFMGLRVFYYFKYFLLLFLLQVCNWIAVPNTSV